MNAKIKELIGQISDALGELENELDEQQESMVAPSKPAAPRVQGRLRGGVLHIQYGVEGNYKRADVELTGREYNALQSVLDNDTTVPSLAGTSRGYVEGTILSDGRLQFGSVVVPSPFWTSGARPGSN